MKTKIRQLILKAVQSAFDKGKLPVSDFPQVEIEEPQHETHGDFATNLAMMMASVQKMAPGKIAETIVSHILDPESLLAKTEIAGPGFINFFIQPAAWHPHLHEIHKKDTTYGVCNMGKGSKIQVEFVSANPTGPLHVGHGRGAAVGDTVGNILSFCGYQVQKEYYINDSGRQIRTLGLSVYLRYKERFGEAVDFPETCYQGEYIREIAQKIEAEKNGTLLAEDREAAVSFCARYAAGLILDGIKSDLNAFGVHFENWYSEQRLHDEGKVDQALSEYKEKKIIYEKDGALWFKTKAFGDEKDRVVVRNNGRTTYFASDIAYHQDKYKRGFERVIDVWGADHHGYVARMGAAVEAMGQKRDQFDVILVHLVNLLRGKVPVSMSTRAGEFVTLKDVVNEVGSDAARFIFLTRHYESPLDFDLELAKKKTNDNPVYYVQYVHARISGIRQKALEQGIVDLNRDETAASRLIEPEEIALIKAMLRFPEVIQNSARLMEPHRITYYLMRLASSFHTYYNKHRVLNEDRQLTAARLYLVTAVQKIIRNGLSLLGVTAPDKM